MRNTHPERCMTMQPQHGRRTPGVETRAPLPGELCTCGRPAVTVYVTERFGAVGYCGIPGARPVPITVAPSDRRAA